MLIRRNDRTGELAYQRCNSPRPTTLHALVAVAGQRWRIEETFLAAKGLTGLDQPSPACWPGHDGDDDINTEPAYPTTGDENTNDHELRLQYYADPNRRRGKKAMTRLIESIRRGVPTGLEEIAQLGRTL